MTMPVKVESHSQFSPAQTDMLRNIICKGASEDEITVFLAVCEHTKLNPFLKQIYLIPRKDHKLNKTVYTPQTSIDGFRLIADRTGKYCPGPKPTFEYDAHDKLVSATAYIKKMTADGTWHTVEATAFFEEYAQSYRDKNTGETNVSGFWKDKPHLMLAKCAESLALRKAFPAELSSLVIEEEMNSSVDVQGSSETVSDRLSQEQLNELYAMSVQLPEITEKIMSYYKITSFLQLDPKRFDVVKDRLTTELAKMQAKVVEMQSVMEGE